MNPEAIEAAAKASWAESNSDPWGNPDRQADMDFFLADAKIQLEAAAPYLIREARAAELEAAAEALEPNPAMVGYESLGIDRAKIRLRRRAAAIRAGDK